MVGIFILAAQKYGYIHSVSAVVMLVAVRFSGDALDTLIDALLRTQVTALSHTCAFKSKYMIDY